MDKPIVIKNVLDGDLFCHMHEIMHKYMKWKLNNRSYSGENHRISFGMNPRNDELIFFQAATIIKLKLLKYIRHKIQLIKIHYNGQVSGQLTEFHTDFNEELSWTFILFTEREWNTHWGGEFVSQHPETEEYFYTPYIPNSGVLVPAYWEHCGNPPLPSTDKMRTTVAFSYMGWNTLTEANPKSTTDWDVVQQFV